jgi:hypothetical protein
LSGVYIASTNLSDDNYMSISYLTSMNGTTDYIEAYGITNIAALHLTVAQPTQVFQPLGLGATK